MSMREQFPSQEKELSKLKRSLREEKAVLDFLCILGVGEKGRYKPAYQDSITRIQCSPEPEVRAREEAEKFLAVAIQLQ